jgi:hypothetical protein
MDLSVEEDNSYVVGGLVSHNSNCKCTLTRTTGGRRPGEA